MTRSALWRSLLVVAVFACASAFAQGERAAVTELRTQWMAAYNSGDLGGVVALYTVDAHTYLPTGEVLHGHAAVQAWMQAWRDDAIEMHGSVTMTLLPIRIDVLGESAYEVGSFNLRASDGTLIDHGNYMVGIVSTSDGWRIAHHMTTSTMLGQQMAQAMESGM